MDNEKASLLYEYERLDLEFEILRSLEERLRRLGKTFAADDLKEARDHLFKSILCVKKSYKFIESTPNYEQIKMNLIEP